MDLAAHKAAVRVDAVVVVVAAVVIVACHLSIIAYA